MDKIRESTLKIIRDIAISELYVQDVDGYLTYQMFWDRSDCLSDSTIKNILENFGRVSKEELIQDIEEDLMDSIMYQEQEIATELESRLDTHIENLDEEDPETAILQAEFEYFIENYWDDPLISVDYNLKHFMNTYYDIALVLIFVPTADNNELCIGDPLSEQIDRDYMHMFKVISTSSIALLAGQQGYPLTVFVNDAIDTPFAKSLRSELREVFTQSSRLTLLLNTDFETILDLASNDQSSSLLIKSKATCGLFDRTEGHASLFEIELEKDLILNKTQIETILVEGVDFGPYTPDEVCGFSRSSVYHESLSLIPHQEVNFSIKKSSFDDYWTAINNQSELETLVSDFIDYLADTGCSVSNSKTYDKGQTLCVAVNNITYQFSILEKPEREVNIQPSIFEPDVVETMEAVEVCVSMLNSFAQLKEIEFNYEESDDGFYLYVNDGVMRITLAPSERELLNFDNLALDL
jgi:hypothetical protein